MGFGVFKIKSGFARLDKDQKIVGMLALLVYVTVAVFFAAEMMLKPISGEDANQQSICWAGVSQSCMRSTMAYMPRVGEVVHKAVIWKFDALPSLGFETLVRAVNAMLSFGIIFLIVMLVKGERPKLEHGDALLFGSVFAMVILSPFAQIFFNGFSNVHNYVPIVFSMLLAAYLWFYRTPVVKRIGKRPYNLLMLIAFSVFSAGAEMGSLILFALLGGYYGVALIRGKKQNTPYLKDRFAGMVGVVLGFLFFWVLGDGWGATVLRSDRGYGGSISISSIFSEPLVAIPQFMANFAGNISDYLPYLILAVIGCALLKRYKRTEGAELDLAVVALIFAVIYITGLSSMPNIMNRFSVMAFMSLMIPIAQGLPIVFARGKVAGALQLGVMLLVMVGMTVDNTLFSANNYKKTRAAVIEVKEKNCIDAAMVKDASLPTRSRIFGFRHSETAFTHLVLNGQGKYYNLDGKRIPIKDNCQLD